MDRKVKKRLTKTLMLLPLVYWVYYPTGASDRVEGLGLGSMMEKYMERWERKSCCVERFNLWAVEMELKLEKMASKDATPQNSE